MAQWSTQIRALSLICHWNHAPPSVSSAIGQGSSDHEEVIDGLVCRCTGYLPILSAALYARDEMKRRQTIDS